VIELPPQKEKAAPVPPEYEFVDFWKWFSRITKIRLKLVGIAGVVLPALAVTYYLTGIIKNTQGGLLITPPSLGDPLRLSYLIHVGVIFSILVIHTRLNPISDDRFQYGNEGQKQLRFWWGVALISFLLLYMFLWVRRSLLLSNELTAEIRALLDSVLAIVSNLCNNLSTLAFLMCFSAMESPNTGNQNKNDPRVFLWTGCLVMLTFFQAIVTLGHQQPQAGSTDWFDLVRAPVLESRSQCFAADSLAHLLILPCPSWPRCTCMPYCKSHMGSGLSNLASH
jgi:hypothetical protein